VTAITRITHPFSTYNHPAIVGVVDAVITFDLSLAILTGSTALHNATAPDGWSYSLDYGTTAIMEGIFALVIGVFSYVMATMVQNRMYLVRSVGRTIWSTILAVAVVTVAAWTVFGALRCYPFSPLAMLDTLGTIGIFWAPVGYRMIGFVDPNGIAKLLVAGKKEEAQVIMASAAAVRGMDWEPTDVR
jgi:hypothetical protein